jgi:tetraacyldisaccharide 4'-kinase
MTQRIIDIISGKDTSLTASLTRSMMSLLTPGYALANGVRQKLFDAGLKKSYALGRPTISVGNLTTGGTGKTPMVAFLVQSLLAMGHRPTILLRGYKSTDAHGSDEAAVYIKQFGEQVPVIANPSRVEGAATALRDHPQTSCFVLDDGFQHRKAKRDLDIVLIDATNPFGYGHLLPRGLMREPMSALKRADSLIITRADQVPPETLAKLDQTITRITGKAPIAHASHQWIGLLDTQDNEHDLQLLNGKPCYAAIAIGNPAAFGNTLQTHASDIKDMIIKPDHHAWPPEEVKSIVERAKTENAIVITTEKDYVKWPRLDANDPVYRVKLAMGFGDANEQQALTDLIRGSVDAKT